MHVRTKRPILSTFTFCLPANAKKHATIDINNTNTMTAALSKSIYVHRTLTVEWQQEDTGPMGDIRLINRPDVRQSSC